MVFPAFVASIAFLFRRWQTAVTLTVTLLTFILAVFAWIIPIGELTTFGPWTFVVVDRLIFYGRQFVLGNSDRSMLIVIYLAQTFFFLGSISAKVSKLMVPLGLAMSAILIAAISVRPFLYAALLIETAVLVGVPLLSSPGRPIERGVLRYLTFLSFGFPFMLFGGWLFSGLESDVTDPVVLLPSAVFLGLGFVFLLAVFPLSTWIPVLIERTHPYPAVFVLTILPTIVIDVLLRFTREYPWLLDFDVILFLGVLMAVTGGIWAAFQRDLGRLLGYAVIVEIGNSLMAISQPFGLPIYAAMFLPRLFAYGVWALSLSLLREQVNDLRFRTVQGMGRSNPLIVFGILTAHFSLAGLPILAGFPVLLALWGQLVRFSGVIALLALFSSVGLMVGALRSFAVLVMGPDEMSMQGARINRVTQLFLLLGILVVVVAGLLPQLVYRIVSGIIGLE
jgi:formate hydrogenlyase subunit 3/multisubunit Na+/H+ antiporter MnhD subunit